MARSIRSCIRALACRRGSTMVGYSSLALLVAIAAITLLSHANTETDVPHQRGVGTTSLN
ncbi:hypothetical protein SAMN02990966_06014 [Rhodospirillales bacterium URHD0017]|nr:hypothetical protein SAMN02990966_06014 [Rhodospirillales bacterium URHD0017]